MPCDPPVQCSKYFRIWGTARASAEGRQGQVKALQPQGRPAEQEADDEAADARDGDRPRIADIPAVDIMIAVV